MKMSVRSHLFSQEGKKTHADFENAICATSRLVLSKVSWASNEKLNPNRVPLYCAYVIG